MLDSGRGYAGRGSDHEFSRATVNEGWERGREHVRGFNALIDDMKPMELGMDIRIYDLDAKTLKREGGRAKVVTVYLAMLWEYIPVQRNPMELVRVKGLIVFLARTLEAGPNGSESIQRLTSIAVMSGSR